MSAHARLLWTVSEPLHALTYFAPESHRAFEEAGLRGFWRGYFAGRAAPLGLVPAEVVTATFYGFRPDFVARAIPSIWSTVDPERAIDARLDGIDRAARRIFGSDPPATDASNVAAQVRRAVEATHVAGRPLFAGNVELAWPELPLVALWHAVTLLREHRGDGHVAALVAAGLGPCEAHVLRVADDALPVDSIQPYRGWSEADWADAGRRLRELGFLDPDGRVTPDGRRVRAELEQATDRLSATLLDHIEDTDLVIGVLNALTRRIVESGDIPYPNPIGVPAPATPD